MDAEVQRGVRRPARTWGRFSAPPRKAFSFDGHLRETDLWTRGRVGSSAPCPTLSLLAAPCPRQAVSLAPCLDSASGWESGAKNTPRVFK